MLETLLCRLVPGGGALFMAILKWVGLDGIDWLCSRQLLKFKCYSLADEGW